MEFKKLLALVLGMGIILAGLGVYGYVSYIYYEVKEVPMFLEVKKGAVGLNTDRDSLDFGKIGPGNEGKRFMEVSFERKAKLVIKAEGEAEEEAERRAERERAGRERGLAEWLEISPNNIVSEAGEKKEITFIMKVPEGATEGKYEGKVKFYFKRI